jgi:arylsulfatase A-like enzyme/Flp pilus assembly protein TadD
MVTTGCGALALLLLAGACRTERRISVTAGQLKGANVLLITVDTLRADRLGTYGNPSSLSPVIDALARGGLRYAHARAHVPMTLPSHASILTGLTPHRTGVHNNTGFRLGDNVPTLATFLKRAGYRTAAFVGAFVLDARFGLAHDFDVYDDRLLRRDAASFHFAERRAADVLQAAGDWILGAPNHNVTNHQPATNPESPIPNPFFAWIHLFDPHAPYDAPAEYRAGRAPYDAEVAYTDAMIGAFLDRLRAAGQFERTLIVLTADHGESLGEHGETTHGLFAYDSTLAVPLIFAGPGIASGVVDAGVAHMDIVPTVLDLVGQPVPAGLDGVSLVHPPDADRAMYFEALDAYLTRGWAPLRGVLQGGWKYIDLPNAELYDLASDPGESRNRIGQDARADAMRNRLVAFEREPGRAAAPAALDADAAAGLRSLGYTGGGNVSQGLSPAKGFSRADDPKSLVALNERFNTALTAFDEGRLTNALDGFADVLKTRPDFLTARTSAATALIETGRAPDAVRLLREAPAQQRAAPEVLTKLAAALRRTGDLPGAAAALEQARTGGDRSPDAAQDLAIVYAQLGRTDAARRLFEDEAANNPSATAWFNLGLFELQSRRASSAAAALKKAVARDPRYGDAWNALGAALAGTDPAGAIDAWQHAEPLLPRDYDLLFNLGMLMAQSERSREAIPYLERFMAEAPRDRYGRDIQAVEGVLRRVR